MLDSKTIASDPIARAGIMRWIAQFRFVCVAVVLVMLGSAPGRGQSCSGISLTSAPYGPFRVSSDLPLDAAVADFNGDGRPDVAFAAGSGVMTIAYANALGGFAPFTTNIPGVTNASFSVDVGDFNLDGHPDVVGAFYGGVQVWLGDGAGGFSAAPSITTPGFGPTSVAVSDIDLDGKPDVVSSGSDANSPGLPVAWVLRGDGLGGFGATAGSPIPLQSASEKLGGVGDFNSDGAPDLVLFGSSGARILPGDGFGSFGNGVSLSPGSSAAAALAMEDLDGDGDLDLVFARSSSNEVAVFLGDGQLGFSTAPGSPFAVGDTPHSVAVADFNLDGHLDLATANLYGGSTSVLLGSGTGSFTEASGSPFGAMGDPFIAVTADFNQDSKADLVTISYCDGYMSVFLNTTTPLYQINASSVAMDVDGVVTAGCLRPAVVKSLGQSTNWTVTGHPGVPYEVIVALEPTYPRGSPLATPLSGGQVLNVNVASPSAFFLYGGTTPDLTPLNPFSLNFIAPASPTPLSAQAFALDFTSPNLLVLSQAVQLQVLTSTPMIVSFGGQEPGRPGTLFSLPSGLDFDFYGVTYDALYVNSDGYVSFGANSTDFTSNPADFQAGPPRIAPQWCDLDPGFGGRVEVRLSPAGLSVDWIDMAEWSNTGSLHNFGMSIDLDSNDIFMWHAPTNFAMATEELVGITPGNNIVPPGSSWPAQVDLSSTSWNLFTGATNGAIWEWFGTVGMPYYTASFSNPWDLQPSTLAFYYVETPSGVHYFVY